VEWNFSLEIYNSFGQFSCYIDFMVVIGVDLGTATTGYGILSLDSGKISVLTYGSILTDKLTDFPKRLGYIFGEIKNLIKIWKVDELALEKVFFEKNTKTALSVSQSQGVVTLSAVTSKIPVFEYTPLQVKIAVTGYGKAGKPQVGKMVKSLLKLKDVPKPDDVADALAVAVCHAYSRKIRRVL